MRWQSLILVLFAALAVRPARGLDFPYVAYVNAADVYVRSGPGRDYYPTNKLQKGQRVEVYRHDPGGWLAVRPPRGSFSWVSSRHLDLEVDDLAAVNADRVVARVGSNFSDVRDVIQVRLDRDEKVVVLEPPQPDSPWCKIEPPAGEFRWVFAKYVDRELPADLAADVQEAGPYNASGAFAAEDTDSVRLTGGEQQSAPPTDPAFAGDLARLRELEHIDMELSEVVAEDISTWSFDELHRRAELALRAAEGSLERGRARVLLDKISRFDDIKRRNDALSPRSRGCAGR